jgi:hypothetical protein
MKRQLITCDRCGDEIKMNRQTIIILSKEKTSSSPAIDKELDLCHNCFEDLERFMERRTLLDSVVRGGKRVFK